MMFEQHRRPDSQKIVEGCDKLWCHSKCVSVGHLTADVVQGAVVAPDAQEHLSASTKELGFSCVTDREGARRDDGVFRGTFAVAWNTCHLHLSAKGLCVWPCRSTWNWERRRTPIG